MIRALYEFLFAILPALGAVLFYSEGSASEQPVAAMLMVCVLACVLFSLFLHLKMGGRLLFIGIALSNVLGFYMIWKRSPETFFLQGQTWLLPVLAISFASFLLALLATRFTPVRILCVIACFSLLVLTLLSYLTAGKGVFVILLFAILCVADQIELTWKREGRRDKRIHMVSIFPFLLLIVLIPAFIKFPNKPYDWAFVVRLWEKVETGADLIRFGFMSGTDSFIGFTDNGGLKDSVEEDKRQDLAITTKEDLPMTIYLSGIVFNTFDGREWKKTNHSEFPENEFDTLESLAAAYGADGLLTDYFKRQHIEVEYLDAKSRYVFIPAKLRSEDAHEKANVKNDGGDLVFKRHSPYHFTFSGNYYRANTDNPEFYSFMDDGKELTTRDWNNALAAMGKEPWDEHYPFDLYREYQTYVKETYSDDTVLSHQVSDALSEVLKGDGDYEKLKNLEAYFQQMQYDTDPGPLPREVKDASAFLDHFLLKERKGYCSYYATAFALTARSMGLPARYVQGYRITVDGKGRHVITSDMAHAWPEVYFAGKGWIAFEPTPGFYRLSAWRMFDQKTLDPERVYKYKRGVRTQEEEEMAEEPELEPEESESLRKEGFSWHSLMLPGIFAFAFLLLFLMAVKLIRFLRVRSMKADQQFKYLAGDCLSICRLMGLGIREGETLSEYQSRVLPETGEQALSFIDTYERILYAGFDCSREDAAFAGDCRALLMRLLKKKRKLHYLIRICF
ncbi:MAG: DUF3488 and DUF4129 domain-containing transglutaminase family protein [Lachnospiraceae bacterium]|nr:DUF3488 and DUF4129 domain-containing transglutaminase family protein [Lachnospiraceae bacterium]